MQNKQPSAKFFTDLEKMVRDFATCQGVDVVGTVRTDRCLIDSVTAVPANLTFAFSVAEDGSHGLTEHDIRVVTEVLTTTYGVDPVIIQKALTEKLLLLGTNSGFYLMAVTGASDGPCPIEGLQLMNRGECVTGVPKLTPTSTMPVLNHDHAWVPARYEGQRPSIGDTVACSWYGDSSRSWRVWDMAEVVGDSEFVDQWMVVRKNRVKGGAVATPQPVSLEMMWTKVRTVFNLKVS